MVVPGGAQRVVFDGLVADQLRLSGAAGSFVVMNVAEHAEQTEVPLVSEAFAAGERHQRGAASAGQRQRVERRATRRRLFEGRGET